LWQHFQGIEIETPKNIFDEEIINLMDFNCDQRNDVHFFYTLPFSKNKALIETTWLSALEDQSLMDYDLQLENYIKNNLGIKNYKINFTEIGAIPLFSPSLRNNNKLESKKETSENADGDKQKPLDIFADECVFESINNSSVAAYCSEEQDGMTTIDKNGKYLIFCDPLDGSSNIDNNISIGTIFSVLPFYNDSIENSLKQNGKSQLCAGFFVYGPQTTLILSLGKEYILFTMTIQRINLIY